MARLLKNGLLAVLGVDNLWILNHHPFFCQRHGPLAEVRMSPDPRDENEPEPMDPKAASRIIKKHIQRKRATERRTRDATPPPSTPDEVEEAAPIPEKSPSPPPEADFLKAILIRNRDLVLLMEHSPESRMADWLEVGPTR